MTIDPVFAAAIAGAVVTLQAWTLKELVGVKVKLAALTAILQHLPCEQGRRSDCPAKEID